MRGQNVLAFALLIAVAAYSLARWVDGTALMICRPIGLDHGPHCDDGDWEHMCDACRETAARTWATGDEEPTDG